MDCPACGNHANVPAAYRCAACGELFCYECIKTHRAGGVEVYICPLCGGQGVSFGHEPQVPPVRPKAFLAKLPEAFVYPFRGSGKFLILGGATFFLVLEIARSALMLVPIPMLSGLLYMGLSVFAIGYLSAYALEVLGTSAQGDDQPPEWPYPSSWWDHILRPSLLILSAGAVSLFPMSLCLLAYRFEYLRSTTAAWGFGVAGMLYLPMAVLGVVLFEGPKGLSPLVVLPSLVKVGPAYLAACGLLAAGAALHVVIDKYVVATIPVVGPLLSWALLLYFLMAGMRVLGLIYSCYERRLNWFPET